MSFTKTYNELGQVWTLGGAPNSLVFKKLQHRDIKYLFFFVMRSEQKWLSRLRRVRSDKDCVIWESEKWLEKMG